MNQWKPAGLQRILHALHKYKPNFYKGYLNFKKLK